MDIDNVKWISLEERKPDEGEQVKIKFDDGGESWAYRGSPPCGNCWYSPFGGRFSFAPTHWHPIPEGEVIDVSKKISIDDLLRNEYG